MIYNLWNCPNLECPDEKFTYKKTLKNCKNIFSLTQLYSFENWSRIFQIIFCLVARAHTHTHTRTHTYKFFIYCVSKIILSWRLKLFLNSAFTNFKEFKSLEILWAKGAALHVVQEKIIKYTVYITSLWIILVMSTLLMINVIFFLYIDFLVLIINFFKSRHDQYLA